MPGDDVAKSAVYPVILSGGAGSRLWPVSRRAHPKPFMQLLDGETMAEKTFRRALRLAADGPVMTVTSRDYFFYTRDLYEGVDERVSRHPFLLEPMGRNTAPAIALAALEVRAQQGSDAIMLVMPADHLVRDEDTFIAAAGEAAVLAARGYLVTFGVYPTHPETGYGYIRRGQGLADSKGFEVAAFVEKPDLETAQGYLESGEYQWNSGMFCFTAGGFIEALERFAPEVAETAKACFSEMDRSDQPLEIPAERFARCPSISIDYAVMEKADNCAVVVGDFGWSDIGTWRAMAELYDSDEAGNSIHGKAVVVESRDCFIQSEQRLVAAVGVDNLVIVDTGDAVLVADRDKAQDVKAVVDHLSAGAHEAAVYHKTVHRPWGRYSVLSDEADCKVRRITVKPGQVLALQLHERRSEHWTVLSGAAKARIGEREIQLKAGDTLSIPAGTRHRLENTGAVELQLVEVQVGEYIGADDIVRYEDVYGTPESKT
jgi:mannose-1-phosphate guanylyltransferase/mannose-6-phosphate isomerase